VTDPITQERRLLTPVPGPRSQALAERKTAAVARGVGTTLPAYIEAADGAILRDVDGNQLIDLGAGIAVTTIGHAAPRVVAAVQEQVADFTHTCFMVTPYEEYVAVCEALNRLTPGAFEKRSALFNSGAEAVENAVKIARAATGRSAVVVFEHGYHGRTNLTMALTAKNMPYKHSFGPFAPEVYRMPMSYPFRDGPHTGAEVAGWVTTKIAKELGPENVAAIVIEPIQGEGGFIVPSPGFLPAIQAYAREHGIVFVADEIQTGFGRTGAWFAAEHEGLEPDLVTIAKGVAGGLPLAAVTGRASIMDAAHVGGLGGTYGGNPVACAAALAAIETYEQDGLLARATAIGERMGQRLRDLQARVPAIGDVRGRGAMMAVELVRPGTLEPDAELAAAVNRECHRQGVVTLTCGTYGNVFRFLPSLVISDALLDEGLGVFEDALVAATA
jgi:4-aminobutyrate aminotransferase/(S)-3-amino-2-methylpropionate transaminase